MENKPKNIDEYINRFPKESQELLVKLRSLIMAEAPEATEAIAYQMPTFRLSGKNMIHFALYKHHLGIYPIPSAVNHFAAELRGYKTSKGAIQFPLDKPIPWDLIRKIVRYRVSELKRV